MITTSTTERVNRANSKQKQFWKVELEELRRMFQKKLLTVTGYLYGIIKTLRQDGWWLSLNISEFAQEYGFSRTSLYRAMTTLAVDGDLDFEWSAKKIRVRFNTQKTEKSQKRVEIPDLPLEYSQQEELVPNLGQDSQIWNEIPKLGTGFPNLGQEQPETITQLSFQDSNISLTEIRHISTDNTQVVGEPRTNIEDMCLEKLKEEEKNEELELEQINSPVVEGSSNTSINNELTHEDQSSVSPRENVSHSPFWSCPNPKLRRDFMKWIVDNTSFIVSSFHAANWCTANPEKADLKWDDFTREKEKSTSRIATFETWESERHEMFIREYKFSCRFGRVFLDNFRSKNSAWLGWVQENHPEWLEDTTSEGRSTEVEGRSEDN